MSTKRKGVAQAVMYELEKYTDDVRKGIQESAERIATEGKTKLQLTTYPPSSEIGTSKEATRREWKRYAKRWAVINGSGKNYAKYIIYQNGKTYRLTHLLEKGHETRTGTRTRAFKHIEPVAEYVSQRFSKEVEEIIKKGGK